MTLKSTNKCCTLCREPWLPKNLIVMKFVQMKFKWVYEGFKLKKKSHFMGLKTRMKHLGKKEERRFRTLCLAS